MRLGRRCWMCNSLLLLRVVDMDRWHQVHRKELICTHGPWHCTHSLTNLNIMEEAQVPLADAEVYFVHNAIQRAYRYGVTSLHLISLLLQPSKLVNEVSNYLELITQAIILRSSLL